MAYYQGSRLSQERMKILINLANKVSESSGVLRIQFEFYKFAPRRNG